MKAGAKIMQKKKFSELISESFDIPLEGISSVPSAQIIGNTLLNLDGCVGIKKYEVDEIIVRSKDFVIHVNGSSLSMLTFSQGRVSIRGNIFTYKIERVGKYD